MANTQLTASSAAMDNNQTNSASASAVSPKGILKNKLGQQESRSPQSVSINLFLLVKSVTHITTTHENSSLTWDEPNLALNDLNRDSTMKITEPKTPFVRYNAETDEVMNLESIPDFDLGRASSTSSTAAGSTLTQLVNNSGQEPMTTEARLNPEIPLIPMRRFSSSSSRRGSGSTERRQVLVQPPVGPSSTAGDDALDDEDEGADLDPDARLNTMLLSGLERDIMDDIESDVAAMSVEESEDLASLPSSKSQPNGA
ncbi:hypothetical protein Pst134EA_003085 [Puccinia striiformis f. sp. tritici]|uniref:hypothetical protein n=1 Tax=Puccinia striiformis f. sp. tritici TaxID=168172 RepID=UPI002007FA50|nr:hypothetical protein Pst134EA_003085 [Puccinia striiformis f. sp. tritici]KAH9472475.1 hypothetical protein Pst134EA_003085 [Puccinia striiformis f. sp. tritici]